MNHAERRLSAELWCHWKGSRPWQGALQLEGSRLCLWRHPRTVFLTSVWADRAFSSPPSSPRSPGLPHLLQRTEETFPHQPCPAALRPAGASPSHSLGCSQDTHGHLMQTEGWIYPDSEMWFCLLQGTEGTDHAWSPLCPRGTKVRHQQPHEGSLGKVSQHLRNETVSPDVRVRRAFSIHVLGISDLSLLEPIVRVRSYLMLCRHRPWIWGRIQSAVPVAFLPPRGPPEAAHGRELGSPEHRLKAVRSSS